MMLLTASLIVCLLLGGPASSEGKNVVVIAMPFTSHTNYHTNVARELIKMGHKVWMLIPDYLVAKGVLNTTGISVMEHTSPVGNVEDLGMVGLRDNYFEGKMDDWTLMFKLTKTWVDDLIRNDTLFQLMKDIKPDMFLIDNLSFVLMLSVIPYKLGVPFSFMGSLYDPIHQRIPFSPAVHPIVLLPYSDHMTFFQRVANTLVYIMYAVNDESVYADAVSRYAPEMPYLPIDMLVAKAEIWLVEQDPIMYYPSSSLPNVKLIGGTATGPSKPLTGKFRAFADNAKEGLVLVTFGSYVLNLPKDLSDKLFKVFLQLPMKFIFRINGTSPDPGQIMTSTWIPQNDLLGHANTRLFVSHCGKNGQYEALYHAIPLLCMPLFADQQANAERARHKGFGEVLDLMSCSPEQLKSTILTVAQEPRYKQTIAKASYLFKTLFGVPKERAAWWLDHVMEHGGSYMHFAGQDIPLYQLMMLDVILFLLCVIFVVVLVSCCLVRKLYACLCTRSRKNKSD